MHRLTIAVLFLAGCASAPIPPPHCPNLQEVTASTAYPTRAFEAGILEGNALVAFTVRADGSTANSSVVSATHPAFATAAADMVSRLRCDPSGADRETRLPVRFRINAQLTAKGAGDRACSPTQERIRHVGYPADAIRLGLMSGNAVVEFTLMADGKVVDAKVVEASHDAFAAAALRYVEAVACRGSGQQIRVRLPIAFKVQ